MLYVSNTPSQAQATAKTAASASSTPRIQKTAVDAEAAKYWEQYFADSGYGAAWTKEVPRRIQAELKRFAGLQAKTAGKVAASVPAGKPGTAPGTAPVATSAVPPMQTLASIKPLATVITDAGVHLEGVAVYESGETRSVQAFVVEFDHDGDVRSFEAVKVR